MSESTGIINSLSASMAGQTAQAYIDSREEALKKIDKLEEIATKLKVKTLKDYSDGMNVKSVLGSLYCYAFNNDNEIYKRIGDIEDIVGKKLFNFVKRQTIKDSRVKAVCRYVLWGRYYMKQNLDKIYRLLIDNDVLRQQRSSFLIIGLHGKTGDNVFTVDHMGREHRQYVNSCAFQAIYINSSTFRGYLEEKRRENKDEIPELEKRYTDVGIDDRKYAIRPIRLRYSEKTLILEEFCR